MNFRVFVIAFVSVQLFGNVIASADENDVSFARDVQPLLAKHCLVCHGPDEAEADLRLDLAESALAILESGKRAIVPGDATASALIARVVAEDESLRMPPEGDSLSESEIDTLTRWIDNGAKFDIHWAYRPVTSPDVPSIEIPSGGNEIDQFVCARLHRAGVTPSEEATRETLVKRLHYDLLGLPPAPSDVDAFVADADPNAYEHLVDRLLASDRFGERWARHWLDKARYADSDGYEKDNPRPNAWRYRDWVIDAINQDMPYDQFSIEQLAGDLLSEPTAMQRLATAFHRQTLTNTEGGTDQEEFRIEATFDRTETTGAIWMGLTMTCARCHTHKYDQITQHEYYQTFAFFNNANETNTDVAQSEPAYRQYELEKNDHDNRLAELQTQYDRFRDSHQSDIDQWITRTLDAATNIVTPIEFHPLEYLESQTASGAKLVAQDDGSFLVDGKRQETDKYTLTFMPPSQPLTGIRVEALADPSLPNAGPGHSENGGFVITELRVHTSDQRDFKQHESHKLVNAQSDQSQQEYPASDALSTKQGSGWAIAPQIGKDHHITCFFASPVELKPQTFLQVVIDQQHGKKHTLGRFRITAVAGFDPLRALPNRVSDALAKDTDQRTKEDRSVIADYVMSLDASGAQLQNQIAQWKESAPKPPMMSVRVIVPAERKTMVLHRGDFLQPSDEVSAEALSVIRQTHPLTSRHEDRVGDRLDFARWLLSERHPLTARVTVNSVWARLFGAGIVTTVNDFGVRGEPPTHPELLDWLAWQFPRQMKWSQKTLIKTIVMSATYRQSSEHRPELDAADPTNRLLARQNRVRVEAELIRDLTLAASGLLSDQVGGPSVFPPLPPDVAELSYANNFKWNTSEGADRYRRGMYTFFKRTAPHPTLITFDCPDSNTTNVDRNTSNTPLQALVTLNNQVFAEAAQALAARILREAPSDDTQRLTYALRLCIARKPTADEISDFAELLATAREYYKTSESEADLLTSEHRFSDLPTAENAAWIATVRVMLNLDEFLVRG